MTADMSALEYQEHCAEMNGICKECHAIRYGNTEPDAEDYECEACGENAVVGIENALMDETIEIVEPAEQ